MSKRKFGNSGKVPDIKAKECKKPKGNLSCGHTDGDSGGSKNYGGISKKCSIKRQDASRNFPRSHEHSRQRGM